MPTYGRRETAKDHPPLARVLALDGLIRGLEKELAALHATRAAVTEGCDHHFIPAPDTADALEPTLCVGVAYAGCNGSGIGHKSLRLDCTRCGGYEITSLSERCPMCARELTWTYGDVEKETSIYFQHRMGVYYALVHLSCPCGFKAVAWQWDR